MQLLAGLCLARAGGECGGLEHPHLVDPTSARVLWGARLGPQCEWAPFCLAPPTSGLATSKLS